MKKIISWVLVLYIAFVFIQSLFFKFAGSVETEIIFSTISQWMQGVSLLAPIAPLFDQYGGLAIGSAELFACILLFISATRVYGAALSVMVMTGAIFFHLFTPLGVDRAVDYMGNTDGGILFYMACGVWLSGVILVLMACLGHDEKDAFL